MKYLIKKDFSHRCKQNQVELKKLCLKFFALYILNVKKSTKTLSSFFKFFILQKVDTRVYSKFSKVSIVRRCVLTGRNRSITRSLGNVSRSSLKDLISMGCISGYRKAVW